MNTIKTLAVLFLFTNGSCFSADDQILDQIQKEVTSLQGAASDAWESSGGGGYVFRFSQDILGDNAAEDFINASIRPDAWHLFTGESPKRYLGTVRISGSGFLMRREGEITTLLDSYQAGVLEKFVIEQRISSSGIQKIARKVGENATEEEYQAVTNNTETTNTVWITPNVNGVLLYDFLSRPDAKWFRVNLDEAELRDGYYRIKGDDNRIKQFGASFTPQTALKLLNRKIKPQSEEKPSEGNSSK